MNKLFIYASLILFVLSLYFLSLKEDTWNVTQYRENAYKDNKGELNTENIPVVVNIRHSTHDLGFALAIMGACAFLAGMYFYHIEERPKLK